MLHENLLKLVNLYLGNYIHRKIHLWIWGQMLHLNPKLIYVFLMCVCLYVCTRMHAHANMYCTVIYE